MLLVGVRAFDPKISPFPGPRDPHLIQFVLGPYKSTCQMASERSNGLSRVRECDRRRTDHATEKCVAIGGMACAGFRLTIRVKTEERASVSWLCTSIALATSDGFCRRLAVVGDFTF